MRSRIIAGSGQAHGTALVNKWERMSSFPFGMRTIGDAAGDAGALASVMAAVISAYHWVTNLFHMGGSYDESNGGELARQFGPTGTGWLGQPWCNAYLDWLKKYRPGIWNGTEDVWTAGAAAPTPWRSVYDQYVAAGMPAGALLDANMRPVGVDEAIAAGQTQQQVAQALTPEQLNALNILAMQVAGLQGAAVSAQAIATVRGMPQAWQLFVADMAAIWVANAAAGGGTGGGGGAQGGGGSQGGGGGAQGGGGGAADDDKSKGLTTLLMVGLGAKVLGVI